MGMGATTPDPRDDRIARLLARLFLAGSAISTALLAVGLAAWMIGLGGSFASACFQGGLLVLMATPIARVGTSAVEYARQRDWVFLATTLAVLAVLTGTLLAAVRSASAGGP